MNLNRLRNLRTNIKTLFDAPVVKSAPPMNYLKDLLAIGWNPEGYESGTALIESTYLNVWAYRCRTVICNAAKRPRPILNREDTKSRVRKVEHVELSHPGYELLEKPNPNETYEDMMESIFSVLCQAGSVFRRYDPLRKIFKDRAAAKMAIIAESPDNPEPLRFDYRPSNGTTESYKPEEVLWGHYIHPEDPFRGLSPVEAAGNSIKSFFAASKWNYGTLNNSAIPKGHFESDTWPGDEVVRARLALWNKLHSGPNKQGSVGWIAGAKFVIDELKHADIEYNALMQMMMYEICYAHGLTPIFFAADSQNYANSREQAGLFWTSKMIPEFLSLGGWFDRLFNFHFSEKGWRLHLTWDFSEIEALREGVVAEAEATRILTTCWGRSPNEGRARRGEEPYDGGDVKIGPMSMVRSDQIGDVLDQKIPATNPTPGQPGGKQFKSIKRTGSERFEHWRATKGIIESAEAKMNRLVRAIFIDWQEETIRRLEARKEFKAADYDLDAILFDRDQAEAQLKLGSTPVYSSTMEAGGKRAIALISTLLDFNLNDPRAQAILMNRIQRFAHDIPVGNWQRLKDSLSEGMGSGETIQQLAQRVRDVMGESTANAATIARTEILPCYHEGSLEGMKQSGVVERKEWLPAFASPRSRHSNSQNDGQQVGLDEYFKIHDDLTGEDYYLRYPGDPEGGAEQVINCMCDLLPVIEEGEEGAVS